MNITDNKKYMAAWICLISLILASLACSLPSDDSSDAIQATQLALEVEATTLALEKAALTQAAESDDSSAPPETEGPPDEEEEDVEATATATQESSEAVEGSLERASWDPAYGWGAGHDSDNFDGATGKFPSSTAGAAHSWYGDGRYNITFTSRSRWTWYWSFLDVEDFYADVVVFNGDQCVPGDTAGLLFRGNSVEDFAIMFGINCGGEYLVGFTFWPGTDGPVCSWGGGADFACGGNREMAQSDLIQTGPGAINRVGVRAKDLDLDFYINGKWVASRTLPVLPPISDHGQFALFLGTAQSTNSSVSFDDFSAWYLD